MSKPARKTDPKPMDEMTPKERATFIRTLRDEARGVPYDPEDNSLMLCWLEIGCSATRH
jgi:hypothetical protein